MPFRPLQPIEINTNPTDGFRTLGVSDTITSYNAKKETTPEKILNFTGGKQISQGLGQALAQPGISKSIDKTQEMQSDIMTNILDQIKKNRAEGKDTSRLVKALQFIQEDTLKTGNEAEQLLNQNDLTNEQVLGDALQLATTAGGAKLATATGGKVIGAKTVGQGILKGAKVGALGGAPLGALTGASQAMKEDMNTERVLQDAGAGAVAGAASGALLGAVTGGISGGINKAINNKKYAHINAVTPKIDDLSPSQYQEALDKGKILPKTSTEPARFVLSKEETDLANKYKSILKTSDPVKNFKSVGDEIVRQDAEVGKFLKENNKLFSDESLRKHVLAKMEDLTDITIPEERLNKGKKQIVDNFIKTLKGNDLETLWEARKKFDQKIEKAFTGSPTLQKEMKREFRNAIQDFIAENTPNTTYKDSMKEMSKLFRLQDMIELKATTERKLSGIRKIAKDNPILTKIIGFTTTGIGLLGIGKVVSAGTNE